MQVSQPTQLQTALKEWQVAVTALAQGDTILLLRKGGIRETGGRFQVKHDRVLLFPTYEHQQPDLLKPQYASQVQAVASGWHPETVQLRVWAIVTETLQITAAERVQALLPFHIWNQAWVTERCNWKPSQPLYLLLLRVYRLHAPQVITLDDRHRGCQSWIELETAVPVDTTAPVLDDSAYIDQVAQIHRALAMP